jgi:hypothetical protein
MQRSKMGSIAPLFERNTVSSSDSILLLVKLEKMENGPVCDASRTVGQLRA